MCVIGKNEVIDLIKSHRCIHPFDYNLLDGDGYILTYPSLMLQKFTADSLDGWL